MKLIAASIAAVALASMDHMDDWLDTQGKASGLRQFGNLQGTVNKLNGRCCWCHFDDDHGAGKGLPLNGLDEACKSLHDCYECAMRDGEDENSPCVPWEVDYVSATGGTTESLYEACQRENDNNCASRACACEGQFVDSLLAFFIVDGGSIDQCPFNAECPVNRIKPPSPKECCGHYPDRYPFKTANGDRACCGQRTYSTLTLECCDEDASLVKFNC